MKYTVIEFTGDLSKLIDNCRYIQKVNQLPLSENVSVNTNLTAKEIKDKIWNDNWMVFPYTVKLINIKPYLNSGFKIVFIMKHFKKFKKEYEEII